jgi:hypothetical protein
MPKQTPVPGILVTGSKVSSPGHTSPAGTDSRLCGDVLAARATTADFGHLECATQQQRSRAFPPEAPPDHHGRDPSFPEHDSVGFGRIVCAEVSPRRAARTHVATATTARSTAPIFGVPLSRRGPSASASRRPALPPERSVAPRLDTLHRRPVTGRVRSDEITSSRPHHRHRIRVPFTCDDTGIEQGTIPFPASIATRVAQALARLSPPSAFDRPPSGASGRIAIIATSAGVAPGRRPAEQAGGPYEREVSS